MQTLTAIKEIAPSNHPPVQTEFKEITKDPWKFSTCRVSDHRYRHPCQLSNIGSFDSGLPGGTFLSFLAAGPVLLTSSSIGGLRSSGPSHRCSPSTIPEDPGLGQERSDPHAICDMLLLLLLHSASINRRMHT